MSDLCLTAMQWLESGELGSEDLELLLAQLASQANRSAVDLVLLLNRQVSPLAA